MIEIRPIFIKDIDIYWPVASRLLEKALDFLDGEWDLPSIREKLDDGLFALFMVFKDGEPIAAVTTRIEEYYTGKKNCIIDFAGGSHFKEWSMFTDYIEPLYRDLGCDNIYIAGRLGWLRLHTDKGFKPIYHVIGKKICPAEKVQENRLQLEQQQ